MKNDDLEKTIPIDVLDLEESTRSDKYKDDKKVSSRAKKYEDNDVDEEVEEAEEILEEGLDDTKEVKTITDLEVEEIEEDEDEPKKGKKDKKKKGNGLIAKFKALPKKKKIFLLILCGIVVVLLTVLIVMLVLGGGKEEETKKEEEEPVKIVDNYYYKKGSLYFLDENEKEIGSYACANKDEEKCYVAYNSSDDVLDIARKYDVNINMLSMLNGLDNEDYIYRNQVIMIPKENVRIYITAEGDTLQNIIKGINADTNKFLMENNNLYLLPEQLIIYKN